MAPIYKHNLAVKMANNFAVFAMKIGIAPKYQYILCVTGKKTGRIYSTPVYIIEENNSKWLVSPYGEVAWVKNARASGKVVLTKQNISKTYTIKEITNVESGPILKKYLSLAPITQPYFKSTPTSTVESFSREASNHPIFRLLVISE